MAWPWSHTDEAYEYAKQRLREISYTTLVEIMAEWRMKEIHEPVVWEDSDAWLTAWEAALAKITEQHVPHDRLVEVIWRKAADQALCDNGGWEAWMCPYGCGIHRVPFGEPRN